MIRRGPPAPPPLSVGALAVADPSANAVGPVRLTAEPKALRIELLRVGRFAGGFAFAGVADAVSFTVPYTAVRGMVRKGHVLHLALDAHVAAPYNRFALARFSNDPLPRLLSVFRLRGAVRVLRFVLPVALGVVAALAVPAGLAGGHLGRAAVGLVVAAIAWRLCLALATFVTWGGSKGERLCAAFERAVSARLGLEPAAELRGEPIVTPAALEGVDRPHATLALGASVRPRFFAAVLTAGVAASVGAVWTVQQFGVQGEVVLPSDRAVIGLRPPIIALGKRAIADGLPKHEPCVCGQVDSPIWRDGMPRISLILTPVTGYVDALWLTPGETYPVGFSQPRRAPDGAAEAQEIAFDLAVVNNAAETLDTVDFVVTFARRDATGRRRNLIERGLHWPGKLRPGMAVKWRVEAEGTEFKIDTRISGRIGEGALKPATGDELAGLRHANTMAVRLHGALMATFVRDPRAEGWIREVGPLSRRQQRVRTQLLATFAPHRICDVAPSTQGVTACIVNGDDRLHRAMAVVARDASGAEVERHLLVDHFLARRAMRFPLPFDAADLPYALSVEPATPP